jgi:hypothetical protein
MYQESTYTVIFDEHRDTKRVVNVRAEHGIQAIDRACNGGGQEIYRVSTSPVQYHEANAYCGNILCARRTR